MPDRTRRFRKENTDQRRTDLITATLKIIAADGFKAATVRTISKEAQVTQGLIRYYFETKDDLIIAAYEKHMSDLIEITDVAAGKSGQPALMRLAKFVEAAVMPPVVGRQQVALWAGFFQLLLHDENMRASHKKTYDLLRLHLKELIRDLFEEIGRETTETELRVLSIAGNGILDGLWLEAGALPEMFDEDEIILAALRTFDGMLGVEMTPLIFGDREPQITKTDAE